MSLPLDIARSHLETLVERIVGIPKAVPDRDGDYLVTVEGASFYARVDGDRQPVIRLFSVVLAGVEMSSELLFSVNAINAELLFLRAVVYGGQVMIEGERTAADTATGDFLELCRRVAHATDRFGAELAAEFSGEARFEASKTSTYAPPSPEFPGYL